MLYVDLNGVYAVFDLYLRFHLQQCENHIQDGYFLDALQDAGTQDCWHTEDHIALCF
jgi:hypothetical protein